MKRYVVASLLTVAFTVVGLTVPAFAEPNTPLSKSEDNQLASEYGLENVPYTLSQLRQIKELAKSQGITKPYISSKTGGHGGYYKLIHASGKNHVLWIQYNDIWVYNAVSSDDLFNFLRAMGKVKTTFTLQQNLKLNNGIHAQWWKVTYSTDSFLELMTFNEGGTWIGMVPNPAQGTIDKPLVQAAAYYLIPLASTSTSSSIPNWFLNDVQIAEHTRLSNGSNYALYDGSDYKFDGNMQTLFGVYSGAGRDIDFGMNLQGLSHGLKTNPGLYGPLLDINVMERIWQANKPIGEMVPAVSIDIGNANYLAFANDQVITASSKSGYIRYAVYFVEGIKTG